MSNVPHVYSFVEFVVAYRLFMLDFGKTLSLKFRAVARTLIWRGGELWGMFIYS